MLSLISQFLSNRSQQVKVNGCRSELVNVVSGVPQGSVLGQLFFLLYTWEFFSTLEVTLIGHADDSSFIAVAPSPGVRVEVSVAEPINPDPGKVSERGDL